MVKVLSRGAGLLGFAGLLLACTGGGWDTGTSGTETTLASCSQSCADAAWSYCSGQDTGGRSWGYDDLYRICQDFLDEASPAEISELSSSECQQLGVETAGEYDCF